MAETLAEALVEIDRLRGVVKAAYHEGAMFESRGDLCWEDSDAKAAIWSTAGAMDGGTLVEALGKAGVVDAGWFNEATDAGTLLRISARFAAPEVKRGLLRQLLGERIDELKHRRSGGIADRVSFDLGTTAASSSASIEATLLLDTLAPSPAPMEGRSNE